MRRQIAFCICLGWSFVGCTGGSGIPSGPPCSVEGITGSVPGVSLSIRASKCVFATGEAATFTYEVKTTDSVPVISIPASMGCGSCSRYSSDPVSLTRWVIGGASSTGQPQQYCVCDTGCCAPDPAQNIRVLATTATAPIQWSGNNWQGPSDTGQKEGPAFAPGAYNVSVTFYGGSAGQVTARLPIEVR